MSKAQVKAPNRNGRILKKPTEVKDGAQVKAPNTELVFCEGGTKIERKLDKDEALRLFLMVVGEKDTKLDCVVDLNGEGARSEVFLLLLAGEKQAIKANCRLRLRGKKSWGRIVARSVVSNGAKKELTSTLDFVSGAEKSSGKEEEVVLLLGGKATNTSTPIILCGEAEVEGVHALSSGNFDEKELFYLMTRGLNAKQAKRVLARASVHEIVKKINDAKVQKQILDRLDKVVSEAKK